MAEVKTSYAGTLIAKILCVQQGFKENNVNEEKAPPPLTKGPEMVELGLKLQPPVIHSLHFSEVVLVSL